MTAVVDQRMWPVTCECGQDMRGTRTTDGDDRTFVLECINDECDAPAVVEHLHREPVYAHLCGPDIDSSTAGLIGWIWALVPEEENHGADD